MLRGRKPQTKAELLLRLGILVCGVSFLGIVAFFAMLGSWHMFQKERDATEAADNARRQLALLAAQKAQLEHQIGVLATPTGVEAALRERYGVIKPGEGVIQIVETQPAASTTDNAASNSLLKKIIDILWPW